MNQQIKPSNVQTYTPGLNGVAARFTDHLKSMRDKNNRISDVSRPLRRLLVESVLKIYCVFVISFQYSVHGVQNRHNYNYKG